MPYYQVTIVKQTITRYLVDAPSATEADRRGWDGSIDEDSATVLKHLSDEIEDVTVMDETGIEVINPLDEEEEEEEEVE